MEDDSADNHKADDNTCREHHPGPPATVTEAASQQRRLVQYERRLELAELAIAIAESVKLWVSVVPWCIQVLYGGQSVLSTLWTEEETLPWPPDPGPLPDVDGEKIGGNVDSEGQQQPGRATAERETPTMELYGLPCSADTEESMELVVS